MKKSYLLGVLCVCLIVGGTKSAGATSILDLNNLAAVSICLNQDSQHTLCTGLSTADLETLRDKPDLFLDVSPDGTDWTVVASVRNSQGLSTAQDHLLVRLDSDLTNPVRLDSILLVFGTIAGGFIRTEPANRVKLLGGTTFGDGFDESDLINTLGPTDGKFIAVSDAEFLFSFPSTVVPIPPSVWLFGSGLLGLIGIARRKNDKGRS